MSPRPVCHIVLQHDTKPGTNFRYNYSVNKKCRVQSHWMQVLTPPYFVPDFLTDMLSLPTSSIDSTASMFLKVSNQAVLTPFSQEPINDRYQHRLAKSL